ncbi:MAG: membrane protein insertion efficiency factor YidD [Ignavibacteria bacterium]|nr:membrane protein insertion efficiency factor YidD [Ignavibacteria bacterium]
MSNSRINAHRFVPRLFILIIRMYQKVVSPLFPPSCRFSPTCSEYVAQSFEQYGVFKGFWLGVRRIVKCNPFHPGGFDPVPPKT